MSRVRNATEFLPRLREILANYDGRYRDFIADARAQYTNNPTGKAPPEIDECLEAHSRHYVVNGLLNALNWRLELTPFDGLPNLIPEAPVTSLTQRSIRFLDYLGAERNTNRPLLVVETKRPSSQLPRRRKTAVRYGHDETAAIICSRFDVTTPGDLGANWNEWLDSLKDYVQSAHSATGDVPRRAVITNGRWLILFVDPADTFITGGTCSPEKVLVFDDEDATKPPEIEERYDEVFDLLAHQHLLSETEPLEASQLPFHVQPDLIDQVMHGLRIKYTEQERIYKVSPVIEVSPIIFVRSRFGAWLRVEGRQGEFIPHHNEDLASHLATVSAAATSLLADVNAALHSALVPISLETHYANSDGFKDLLGVVEINHDEGANAWQELVVVTGSHSHYLLPEPTVPDCPYHDWSRSEEAGYAFGMPIEVRSVNPRSFFKSRELHHCSHRLVAAAKAEEISAENRMRCGSRSGRNSEAFCEVWRLDQYLCCRTCVFQNVCTKAEVFTLPCHIPNAVGVNPDL